MFKNFSLLTISLLMVFSCSQVDKQISQDINSNSSILSETELLSKPSVVTMNSPHRNDRPAGTKIDAIVLHHTANTGDAKNIGTFFLDPAAKVSAHYIVDKTGYLVQSVDDTKRSWHAGKSIFNGRKEVNDFSIGIEICNVGDNVDPYPDAQYNSLIKLLGYLVQTYNIPVSNITRHRDIAIPAGRKTDTSDNFSLKRLNDGLKNYLAGTYKPEINPEKTIKYSDFRTVNIKEKSTLKEIAEEYFDAESRWNELKLLNPNFNENDLIPAGTKINLPLSLKYYFQLKK